MIQRCMLENVKVAQRESICHICKGVVEAGSRLWPIKDEGEVTYLRQGYRQKYHWSHIECAVQFFGVNSEDELQRPPCPYWLRNRLCVHGASCCFAHDGEQNKSDEDQNNDLKNTLTFSKLGRVGVFRRFLLDTFQLLGGASDSKNDLKSDHDPSPLILDVAGGKGELAFEFLNLNNLASCVIDPRVISLKNYEEKLRRGRYASNDFYRSYNVLINNEKKNNVIYHMKVFLDAKLLDWTSEKMKNEQEVVGCEVIDVQTKTTSKKDFMDGLLLYMDKNEENKNLFWKEAMDFVESKVLIGESTKVQSYNIEKGSTGKKLNKVEMEVDYDKMWESYIEHEKNSTVVELIKDGEKALDIFNNITHVVGMHPDGAAGAAIEFALARKLPFAIIPCCTCSKDFPRRKILVKEKWKLVKSYDDLLVYLQGLHQNIRREELPFEGRRTVLFMTSADYDEND